MSAPIFGWELLFKSVEDDIKNNQDLLFCFAHLVLIANGFKCVGLGDSKHLDGTETKTESLPKGWSTNYAVRYVLHGHLYNLRGTNVDDAIMLNLIRVQERTVSMVQLHVLAVAQRSASLDQAIPNYEELAQTIKKQLVDKIAVSTKYKDDASQTDPLPTPSSSRLLEPRGSERADRSWLEDTRSPLHVGVGRADLDPLFPLFNPDLRTRGGGGMIFVPPDARGGPPNLGIPPGSVPPGARFDPFRPPDVDGGPLAQRPRRTGDEMPPPHFEDMFM